MIMTKLNLTAAFLLISLLGPSAWAAKFANQFTEFELPPQWSCNLEGAEWVCQSADENKKRDAIIVLAAKLKGDQDSLDQYLEYLKTSKVFNSVDQKQIKSEAKYAKTVNINGQPWVDALHLESEIPGFYTRYLATVKADIGVLITYSINKSKYADYQRDFENMIKTLKVFRKPGQGLNAGSKDANLFDQTKIPGGVSDNSVFPGAAIEGGSDQPKRAKKDELPAELIIGGAALVAFLIWKKKKKGGR